ncbi:MAG: hypothetical protein HFJ50_03245 [Clostridia bacterium]|nr:hypothetical protein [Clostridia bacterium]
MKIEQDNDIIIKEKKPRNKIVTIISILIILTILVVIGIIVLMVHVEDSKLSVNIDGKKVNFTEDTFMFVENTGELYVSIGDIAPLVGYEAHKGEYKVDSEDTTKMYVEAMNRTETTSFYLNSRLINKVPPDSEKDYESIQISAPVIENNGKLYVNAEGFTQGFNSVLTYNKAENDITIQTLPYLVLYYTNNITNYGFDKLSEDFANQKALVYGMVVGSKQTTGKYGVKNARTNADIIGSRYNKIEFIEASSEFIITNSSGKVGIAHSTGETKINVQYDEIKVLDGKLRILYSKKQFKIWSNKLKRRINSTY